MQIDSKRIAPKINCCNATKKKKTSEAAYKITGYFLAQAGNFARLQTLNPVKGIPLIDKPNAYRRKEIFSRHLLRGIGKSPLNPKLAAFGLLPPPASRKSLQAQQGPSAGLITLAPSNVNFFELTL